MTLTDRDREELWNNFEAVADAVRAAVLQGREIYQNEIELSAEDIEEWRRSVLARKRAVLSAWSNLILKASHRMEDGR